MSTGLSHPRALTPISDPIHTRFEFNVFEREFIDSIYFQRLHFVLQNSATYVAFPSNKNTRFPHSLGVAHIAGNLFTNALSKSNTETLEDFLENSAYFLEHLVETISGVFHDDKYQKVIDGHAITISSFSGFQHNPLLRNHKAKVSLQKRFGTNKQFSASFIVDTFWLALRVYGLTHDIGHLPMSHAFEHALKDQKALFATYGSKDSLSQHFETLWQERKNEFSSFKGQRDRDRYTEHFADILKCGRSELENTAFHKAFHEIRGISIFNRFVSKYDPSFGGEEYKQYAQLIHYLVLCLVFSPAIVRGEGGEDHEFSFLFAIRNLVDGEIDADRLDYTLRDGHESGSDIGRFDLSRICANSILVKKENTKHTFAFGYYIRGISGIEQFFEQRYQSYKYIIYHRTSSRSNKCLEHLIAMIFHYSFSYPDSKCGYLLSAYGYVQSDEESGKITKILPDEDEDIVRVDDANLRTILFRIRNKLSLELREKGLLDSGKKEDEIRHRKAVEILNLVSVVVYRDFSHIVSPLKKKTFEEFFKEAVPGNYDRSEYTRFFKSLQASIGERTDQLRKVFLDFTYDGMPTPVTVLVDVCWPKVYGRIDQKEVHFSEQIWIFREDGTVVPVEDWSPTLRFMRSSKRIETLVRIYLIAENIKGDQELESKVTTVLQDFLRNEWEAFQEKLLTERQGRRQ